MVILKWKMNTMNKMNEQQIERLKVDINIALRTRRYEIYCPADASNIVNDVIN